jgi:hypothetical protein
MSVTVATTSSPPKAPTGRRQVLAVLGIMAAFSALTSVIAIKTPAWEAQDEPDHVQNVEVLAAGHWYRIPGSLLHQRSSGVSTRSRFISNELHQPPLYYLLLAAYQRLIGLHSRAVDPGPASFLSLDARRGLYLHHSSSDHRFVLYLRFPNVLLGILTMCLTFLAARLISSDPWTPVIAAAIVAFVPRFVFISSFVTNDNLVNTLGAGLAYAGVRAARPPGRLWVIIVAGLLGLLVITKLSALPALIVLLPVLVARTGWRERTRALAAAIAVIVAVGGWYLIQNDVRYGDPLALSASKHYLEPIGGLGTFGPYVVTNPLRLILYDVPSRIWWEFWHASTMPPYSWPWPASALLWGLMAFALAGLLNRSGANLPRSGVTRAQLTVLASLVLAAFASVWLVAFNTAAYDARLALVGLPALACLAGLGLEHRKVPLRLLLPVAGLGATLVAIYGDVLSVHWNP